jgi:hypothetical protein
MIYSLQKRSRNDLLACGAARWVGWTAQVTPSDQASRVRVAAAGAASGRRQEQLASGRGGRDDERGERTAAGKRKRAAAGVARGRAGSDATEGDIVEEKLIAKPKRETHLAVCCLLI